MLAPMESSGLVAAVTRPPPIVPMIREQIAIKAGINRKLRRSDGIRRLHLMPVYQLDLLELGLTNTRAAGAGSRFHANRFPLDVGETARLIANANQEHRLTGVLQNIDNPFVLIFEIDRLSVGDQV